MVHLADDTAAKDNGADDVLQSRAYQLEMYHDSLHRNIIVGESAAVPRLSRRNTDTDGRSDGHRIRENPHVCSSRLNIIIE